MKKGNVKSFFLGAVTMLLIFSLASPALATASKVTKTIEYKNIGVSLDGKKLSLKDAAGNAVEPFMFNGTNYVPARAIAEALGLSVSWDNASNMIVLKSESAVASTTSGTVLVDQGSIQIYYMGITASDSYSGGYGIGLKIVNNSSKDVIIQADDLSVNGIMSTALFSCTVAAGKTAYDSIDQYKYQLDKLGITTVDKANFKLLVIDPSTYTTLYKSSEIEVTR